MTLLHIAFQEGFQDDTVQVRVDGREVTQMEHVTTRTQIGLADSFEMDVQEGMMEVEVLVPSKALSKRITLPVSNAVYLGVSVDDRGLIHRVSEEPFGYL